MKIIYLDPLPDPPGYYGYYTEDFNRYYQFEVTTDESSIKELTWSFPIRDYEHFAGIMGKFMPHTIFLSEPIEIKELTLEELRKAESKYPAHLWDREWI